MATNNKASVSRYDTSDSSDDDGEHPENLSMEEISLKMKTFRDLCFGNEINASNAFDIDMVGYFHSWLEKKKSLSVDDDEDATSFQEISDYLEATAKVYSYRVDNFTERTGRLVEQFKSMRCIKNTTPVDDDDDDDAPKIQKSKRQNMMLTTNEKLRRSRPNEMENTSNLNCNELVFKDRPSHTLTSMYHNKSLAEEEKNVETILVDRSFFDIMDEFNEGVVCPELNGFVAECDKVDNYKEDKLDGIEYRFNPDDHQLKINSEDSVCGEPENIEHDSNSNDKDTTVFDGLLKCIDGVDRNYSLKSCTPSERKDIVSNIDENIDECTLQDNNHIKTFKKRIPVTDDTEKINWPDRTQLKKLLEKNIRSKEKVSPRTLQKWEPLDAEDDDVIGNMKSESRMDIAELRKEISDIIDEECVETDPNSVIGNMKSESRMDIAELKKEISDIIDEECVETDPNSEWSSKLSFLNLLIKLRINERDGLTIPIIFVGLLHLANERGLKLFQEYCTINDMEETYIAKPMKNN